MTYELAFEVGGGGEVLLTNANKYLRREGIESHIYGPSSPRIRDADVLHVYALFQHPRNARRAIHIAKKEGIATVLTPIFWTSREYFYLKYQFVERLLRRTYFEILRYLPSALQKFFPLYADARNAMLEATAIMTNTKAEFDLLRRFFRLPKEIEHKFYWFPCGVEPRFARPAREDLFRERYRVDNDYILYTGRIEPRKNIHKIIRAFIELKNPNATLVIIGKPGISDDKYYEYCKKLSEKAPGRILFIPWIPHNSKLIESAYAGAKVFILPSYFETPGISALEAGAAGANIVITNVGGTREYFERYAWYVDPTSQRSISRALVEAFHAERSNLLRKHITKNFLWPIVAKRLVRAYEALLEQTS